MKKYAPVDFDNCRFPEAAKEMARGIEGIQKAHNCDIGRALELISDTSEITLNSIKQMRNGVRDPRRSATAVSAAIKELGGPIVIFPSQLKRRAPEDASATQDDMPPALPLAVHVPASVRGVRIEITFL